MDKTSKLANQLQDAEVIVLKQLSKSKSLDADAVVDLSTRATNSVVAISSATKLKPVEVGRAAMYLENKGLARRTRTKTKHVELDVQGQKYAKSGLPEFKFLELVKKPIAIDQLKKHLAEDEVKFSLGYWKKKGMILFDKGLVKTVPIAKPKTSDENDLIKKLARGALASKELASGSANGLAYSDLSPKEQEAVKKLGLRKAIIKIIEKTAVALEITPLGRDVAKNIGKVSGGRVGKLIKSIIRTGGWKKGFRRYDVEAPVPKLAAGRPHPYLAFLDEVKQELTSMGFTEMTGPLVESNFFNCDALYMPQDHPARGIHDLYQVKGKADLGQYRHELSEVKRAHEDGGNTGSTGWQVPFSTDKTKELILPSQGTRLSARTLIAAARSGIKEGKYFALARCFRPDVVDKTHLTEFNQLEGIVIGKGMNFSQLLGLLSEFAKKLAGVDKIKFVPGYFPFTEPSVEGFVQLKDGRWTEIFAAGVLRPEVTVPLGITEPVLAWGPGIDRLYMVREGLNDIRQLFSSDLKWLREAKL